MPPAIALGHARDSCRLTGMKPSPPYSPTDIIRFSGKHLRPKLAADFLPFHKNRDLVRQRLNFVQLLALSGGRYGETLKVLPTFYVLGARPSDEIMPQTVALSTKHPERWRFQGRHLDDQLADDICSLLKVHSPLSFFSPVGVDDVVSSLKFFCTDATSEDAPLFLAFFMMANGIPGEKLWIEKARKCFLRQNPVIQHDWQRSTLQRIEHIERLSGDASAEFLCQQEANNHAARLRLPKIVWTPK